jgi:hypothetical protein
MLTLAHIYCAQKDYHLVAAAALSSQYGPNPASRNEAITTSAAAHPTSAKNARFRATSASTAVAHEPDWTSSERCASRGPTSSQNI